jgi:Lipopolysaccharide biosynthesis proteins, LPS:glycosyltransferases
MTADFLFVSDDNYVKNLGICTYSVMHNMCPEVDKVRLFVMDCGITEENKAKLHAQAGRFDNAEMIFYDIDEKLNAVVPKVKTRWRRAIYGRLFLNELPALYPDLSRLIYLDCDLLMDRAVTELFTMDLEGKCLAAVTDADNAPRKEALGIPPECEYINSGVLVIDTARWIDLDASRRIIEYINSFPAALLYPDQDAINYVLGHEIVILPPEFNMMWMICERDIPKMLHRIPHFYYSAEQIRYALYHPFVVHFAGHDMWSFDGITPVAAGVFKKYRRLCDWRDCKRRFRSAQEFFWWCAVSLIRIIYGDYKKANASRN